MYLVQCEFIKSHVSRRCEWEKGERVVLQSERWDDPNEVYDFGGEELPKEKLVEVRRSDFYDFDNAERS